MKKRNILPLIFMFIMAAAISGCSNSRKIKVEAPLDSTEVRNMVDSQLFTFIPRYVNPMSGRRRALDPGYELSISKDSLISYLPYFGRGYIASISPSDVDYDFTSTSFSYDVKTTRKGWSITIKPKDQQSVQEMYFTIFDNGVANLTITSMNRSSISYDGYLSIKKDKIKKKT